MVQGKVPSRIPSEGEGLLPEAAQRVGAEFSAPPASENPAEKKSVQGFQQDEVLPEYGAGLGGDRSPNLPARIQHAEPSDPPEEPKLLAP